MPKYDIIYILKEDINPEELRYSLRSIEKNFPHNKVWFIGGQPRGFRPDFAIKHRQSGETKWDKIRSSMLKAIAQPELTDKFFLFNDDFFVMKPAADPFVNYAEKTLTWRIEKGREINPWLNHYCRSLYKTREELKSLNYKEINFEVHLPMLFEKSITAASITKCSAPQMRSIYGNVNGIPYQDRDDVKINDLETVPEDADYISTTEQIFEQGKVGAFIRAAFPNPCKYEEGNNDG